MLLLIITCYEEKKKKFFFEEITGLLYSLKKHSKILPFKNSGDSQAVLTFYELCKSWQS